MAKNHECLEFTMLFELEQFLRKHPDNPELEEMRQRWRKWINENSISVLQNAHWYAFVGEIENMDDRTRSTMKSMTESVLEKIHSVERSATPARAKTRKKK